MDRNKKKLFWLVFAGLFSIMFLTLLTISFYGYVLEKIGVDHAENIRSYDKHFVMIVGNTESQFWKDVYASVKEEAADQNAYVELKGTNQSSAYSMTDFMDMSIAAKVDGILLECTAEEALEEKINEATDQGIPVVTILNDAPGRSGKVMWASTHINWDRSTPARSGKYFPRTGNPCVSRCCSMTMPLTATSHRSFTRSITGWSHLRRRRNV